MNTGADRIPRVLVVGAGMGGLAAAIELAAHGASVTLVETQPCPGGKMREVVIAGEGVDSGPTVFTMRRVFEEIFAHAGGCLADSVTLTPAVTLARHSWLDGSRLDLFADRERNSAAIESFAGPREAAGYRAFARQTERVFELLDPAFMRRERPGMIALARALGMGGLLRLHASRPFTSLWKATGRYFRDPRLRQLFGRYATYCGSSPFSAPATLMLIAHAEQAGVWRVSGGMQRLAEALADLAGQVGAELRYSTTARAIGVAGGRVTGVELEDGSFLPADAVVFNGDVQALTLGLLGTDAATAVRRRGQSERSLSAVTWSLRAPARGFPMAYHTVFFGRDYRREFNALFGESRLPESPTIYVCSQDAGGDAEDGEELPQRRFVLVNAPPRILAADELSAARATVAATLAAHGLDLDLESPGTVETTSSDYARRFPGSDGAIYGWPTHGWASAFRRHGSGTGIAGLYLAGGTVHPGPGIPMAALSGRLAAARVCRDWGLEPRPGGQPRGSGTT